MEVNLSQHCHILFCRFPNHVGLLFEEHNLNKNKKKQNEVIDVPISGYHLEGLLILIMLVFYVSFVDIKKD